MTFISGPFERCGECKLRWIVFFVKRNLILSISVSTMSVITHSTEDFARSSAVVYQKDIRTKTRLQKGCTYNVRFIITHHDPCNTGLPFIICNSRRLDRSSKMHYYYYYIPRSTIITHSWKIMSAWKTRIHLIWLWRTCSDLSPLWLIVRAHK